MEKQRGRRNGGGFNYQAIDKQNKNQFRLVRKIEGRDFNQAPISILK